MRHNAAMYNTCFQYNICSAIHFIHCTRKSAASDILVLTGSHCILIMGKNSYCDVRIYTRHDSAHLKVDVDEQFVWKAEVNTGQCNNSLLDTELRSTLLMKDSSTHVGILSSLTETSHLMVLCQLIVDLHRM